MLATPASDFAGTTIAQGLFDEIDVKNYTVPADLWQARLKTQGQSRLFVQSNVWQPGGSTGWHTHPGFSLIVVTAGTVTIYDGDDPACTPHEYTVGQGFVDPGGDHSHVIRNEGSVEARTTTVQLIREGAARRIDMPNPYPGSCPQ
jgi:hypothetical protein